MIRLIIIDDKNRNRNQSKLNVIDKPIEDIDKPIEDEKNLSDAGVINQDQETKNKN